jgi:hypothetical protein
MERLHANWVGPLMESGVLVPITDSRRPMFLPQSAIANSRCLL